MEQADFTKIFNYHKAILTMIPYAQSLAKPTTVESFNRELSKLEKEFRCLQTPLQEHQRKLGREREGRERV